MGLDLPFLIATSISLRAAAAISLELMLIHMGTVFAALFTCRFFSGLAKPLVNVAVSTIIMVFARLLIIDMFRGVTDALGIYIYLMAVNGMTIYQANRITREDKPFPVLASAFMNVLGFTLAMFVVSLFREYFGAGTLWGTPVPVPIRLDGIRVPFFGFVMIGFVLAGVKWLNKALLAFSMHEKARRDARFLVVAEK